MNLTLPAVACGIALGVVSQSGLVDTTIGPDSDRPDAAPIYTVADAYVQSADDLRGCLVSLGPHTIQINELVFGVTEDGELAPALVRGATIDGEAIDHDRTAEMAHIFNDVTEIGGVFIHWPALGGECWVERAYLGRGADGFLKLLDWDGVDLYGVAHSASMRMFDPQVPCDPNMAFGCQSIGTQCVDNPGQTNEKDQCHNPHMQGGKMICDCNQTGGQSSECQVTTIVSCPTNGFCPDPNKPNCLLDPSNPVDCKCQ